MRDLRCAPAIHEAVDAGLHLMERCTGRLVDCKKEEIFIITYCATGRRSLGRHTDGDGKRTLLITLDASRDYAGGGTRFYPKEASAPSFVVRPARGAAVGRALRRRQRAGAVELRAKRRLEWAPVLVARRPASEALRPPHIVHPDESAVGVLELSLGEPRRPVHQVHGQLRILPIR